MAKHIFASSQSSKAYLNLLLANVVSFVAFYLSSAYKNGLNRRTDLYLKEHDHLRK